MKTIYNTANERQSDAIGLNVRSIDLSARGEKRNVEKKVQAWQTQRMINEYAAHSRLTSKIDRKESNPK